MKAFHKFSQFNPYENKSIPINIAEVSLIQFDTIFISIARMSDGRMERCLGTLEVVWQPWRLSSGTTSLQAQEQTQAQA